MINSDAGQFIDLIALADLIHEQGDRALLPDWATVRSDHPHLLVEDPGHRRRLFITHRWDEQVHPDPTGWQRRALRELGEHYAFRDRRPCIWFDFMSLPQKPRVDGQGKIFTRGLDRIRQTVAACENITLVSKHGNDTAEDLAATLQRGWILFELLIARNNMKMPLPLYERVSGYRVQFGRDQTFSWDGVVADIATCVPFDSADLILAWFQQREVACTNGSDLRRLAELLHAELTERRHAPPDFEVRYDEPMRLTHAQLSQLEILEASGLSGSSPELFLVERDRGEWDAAGEVIWTVVFAKRPPMPALGTWTSCHPDELVKRRIEAKTMTSPMYPGIIFEFDGDALQLRARLKA